MLAKHTKIDIRISQQSNKQRIRDWVTDTQIGNYFPQKNNEHLGMTWGQDPGGSGDARIEMQSYR